MSDGFFLVQFIVEDDYKHALFDGPWMIADHYIIVQRWRSTFLESMKMMKKVVVWVRFPRLPMELYHDTFLQRAGSMLGIVLKIDKFTSIHSRGKFLRIYVEVDL